MDWGRGRNKQSVGMLLSICKDASVRRCPCPNDHLGVILLLLLVFGALLLVVLHRLQSSALLPVLCVVAAGSVVLFSVVCWRALCAVLVVVLLWDESQLHVHLARDNKRFLNSRVVCRASCFC